MQPSWWWAALRLSVAEHFQLYLGVTFGFLLGYLFALWHTNTWVEEAASRAWIHAVWDTLRCVHWHPPGHKQCDCPYSFRDEQWPFSFPRQLFYWAVACRVEDDGNPDGRLVFSDLGKVSDLAKTIFRFQEEISGWDGDTI